MIDIPLTAPTRVAAAAALGSAVRVWKVVLVAGADNASTTLTNDTDGAGTAVLKLKALANSQEELCFASVGGVVFDTDCYVALTGTSPEVYLWVTAE